MKKSKIDKVKCLEMGLLLALISLILGYYFHNEVVYIVSGSILLLSLIFPKVWKPLAFIWFRFGELLGIVVSRVLLTFIFFIVVLPMAYFRRLLGKDLLQLRKFKKDHPSGFLDKNKLFISEDLNHQF
ncbi:MAG: SxtJ family membrane protein [Cyclobacteriaceae bacterium]